MVRKQIEIAFVTLAQQTLLPSTMAISSPFNRQTQRHSPLKKLPSHFSSNIKNYISVVTCYHQRRSCDRSFLTIAATTTAGLAPYRLLLTEASIQRKSFLAAGHG
jgi:hypothetical protein